MNQRIRRVTLIAAATFFALVALALFAHVLHGKRVEAADSAGMEPYTPSRLQWLAMDLEASYRLEYSEAVGYAVDYIAIAPDTIVVEVDYSAKTSAKLIDNAVDHAAQLAKRSASRYGWADWVKVKIKRKSSFD